MKAKKPRTLARLLKRAAWIVAAMGGVAVAGWLYARQWRPPLDEYPIQGIDVSHHQGAIDWPLVRADGVDFAYIRATGGIVGRDPRFAENWARSGAAGVKRGAYHLFTLCRPAADQAASFITTVPREAEALPPAVSLEFGGNCARRPSRQELHADLRTFLSMVERHSGKPAVLQVSEDFEEAYAVSSAVESPLWLRNLFFRPDYGARQWVMWQASDMHRIDGIEGPVDWNVVQP